jgi:hypothetical protein
MSANLTGTGTLTGTLSATTGTPPDPQPEPGGGRTYLPIPPQFLPRRTTFADLAANLTGTATLVATAETSLNTRPLEEELLLILELV